ncbi:MAG: hypothetical protein IPH07_02795 [Deltaproteobacteria bacterium]|nr:hypothetical protein [Deltaproteobacteria bacterium]MBK8718596.1 hypothetical protein [Deltaproteobacteria bacterium]MBP7290486.1 hypothetical protein [Nannocystaceae bacterium]
MPSALVRAITIGLVLSAASCGPQAVLLRDDTPIVVHASPRAPEPTAPPETPRLAPLHRAPAFLFHPAAAPLSARAVTKAVRVAAVRADGLRIEGDCRGASQVTAADGTRHRLPTRADASAIAIAPDGAHAAISTDAKVSLVALDPVRTLGTWEGRDAVWLDGDTLLLRQGCRLETLHGLRGTPTLSVLGESCGRPLRVEPARGRVWLAEFDDATPAEGSPRLQALVGMQRGAAPQRVELSPEDDALHDPRLSHDASILCGTARREDRSVLLCRPRDAGRLEPVAQDIVGAPVFARDAPRLLVTVGPRAQGPRDLHVVDFELATVRRIARVPHRRVEFLPGATQVFAFDGARGVVYDLDTGVESRVGGEQDDWVGVLPNTPDAGSFLALRLRGGCNELLRVELPSASAADDPSAP